MAKLGKIKLLITDEDKNASVNATSYPVEKGEPYTDHVSKNPKALSITGYILGSNYKSSLESLENSMDKGEVLNFTGRTIAKNVIILDISDKHNSEVSNGCEVSIQLQVVRTANTPWEKVPVKQKTQQKKTTNSGKKKKVSNNNTTSSYHVIRKGESYYSIAKKYKTTVNQLQDWNKWTGNTLPIGGKMRIK